MWGGWRGASRACAAAVRRDVQACGGGCAAVRKCAWWLLGAWSGSQVRLELQVSKG